MKRYFSAYPHIHTPYYYGDNIYLFKIKNLIVIRGCGYVDKSDLCVFAWVERKQLFHVSSKGVRS
jgi:hypothetical protein